MAGKAEVASRIADPGVKVFDIRRVDVFETQAVTGKPQAVERGAKHAEGSRVFRGDAGTADQRLGQRDGVAGITHGSRVSPAVIR